MSSYFSGLLVVTLLCMALAAVSASSNKVLTKPTRMAFVATFFLIAVAAFLEWYDLFLGVYYSDSVAILTFIKALELSIAPCIPFTCATIFREQRSRLVDAIALAVIVAHALLELGSTFVGGITFTMGPGGEFQHAPLYWVYVVVITASEVLLIVRAVRFSHVYQNRNSLTLAGLLVLLVACACVQFRFPDVKITWHSVALAAIFFYIYFNDLVTKVDPLTKVLNRLTFDNNIASSSERMVFIILDVDDFKIVNDTHGHLYGDACLKAVAQQIKESYGRYGLCFRYGGDEFAVLLNRGIDHLDVLNEEFAAGMARRRAADPLLPQVSLGYAYYTPGQDSVEAVTLKADEMLYRNKAAAKGRC